MKEKLEKLFEKMRTVALHTLIENLRKEEGMNFTVQELRVIAASCCGFTAGMMLKFVKANSDPSMTEEEGVSVLLDFIQELSTKEEEMPDDIDKA